MNEYKVIRKLATTLCGSIFECVKKSTNEKVAVKVAAKTPNDKSLQILENVQSEIQIMKAAVGLRHIIQLADFWEDAEAVYIAMELAEHGDLFSNLASSSGKFDEQVCKKYFKQVLGAVKDLHDQSICHLDVSLENVLISAAGGLKLCDFGVAAQMCDSQSCRISTQKGKYRPGKLMYMSPECSVLGSFDGFKADVYSLGVMLFCMLYGFNPYDAQAVLNFRNFQLAGSTYQCATYAERVLDQDYAEHLLCDLVSEQVTIADLSYVSIISNDVDALFDLYGLRGIASAAVEDLICCMLSPEVGRATVADVVRHSWTTMDTESC